MKIVILVVAILGLILGCATGPPVRSPQFTESNLPTQHRIEGIEPMKNELAGSIGAELITCVDMILNFYRRPLDPAIKKRRPWL